MMLSSGAQAFIPAVPLHTATNRGAAHVRGRLTRRRPRVHMSAAKTPPPSAHESLHRALARLHSFTGSGEEARELTVDLLDTVSEQLPGVTEESEVSTTSTSITRLYEALVKKGHLRAFSRARAPTPIPTAQKAVSVERLVARAGLPLSALSARRSTVLVWQLAGVAAVVVTVQTMRAVGMAQYTRPALLAVGFALGLDQVGLRGAGFESVYRTLFPRYREKISTHEAGHFLAAYLHGLPVRGYVLSAREAVQLGIPGQAGTLFSDDELLTEVRSGRLSSRAVDRFSIVAMAGIAAEAITYGEAEGGQTDEADLARLLGGLQPPWSAQEVKRQARWAVLEAIMLLRRQEGCLHALKRAMSERRSLGECVACIEEEFVDVGGEAEGGSQRGQETEEAVLGKAEMDRSTEEEEITKREDAIVAELKRIGKRMDSLAE